MDDFSSGRINTMHQTTDKEQHIWLWHQGLGHPSFSYLKHLFLSLFSDLYESNIRYKTCILAKSHRVSYPISLKNLKLHLY